MKITGVGMLPVNLILRVLLLLLLLLTTATTLTCHHHNDRDAIHGCRRMITVVQAFQHQLQPQRRRSNLLLSNRRIDSSLLSLSLWTTSKPRTKTTLNLFGKREDGSEKTQTDSKEKDSYANNDDKEPLTITTVVENEPTKAVEKNGNFLTSFFNRIGGRGASTIVTESTQSSVVVSADTTTDTVTTTKSTSTDTATTATTGGSGSGSGSDDTQQEQPKQKSIADMTSSELAQKLFADAERVRLEARLLDAELTSQKIERLNREVDILERTMSSGSSKSNAATVERIKREMNAIRLKIYGDETKTTLSSNIGSTVNETAGTVVVAPSISVETTNGQTILSTITTTTPTTSGTLAEQSTSSTIDKNDDLFQSEQQQQQQSSYSGGRLDAIREPFNQKEYDEFVKNVAESPEFTKRTLAMIAGIESDIPYDKINVTEYASRLYRLNQLDFSQSTLPKPTFTNEQIEKRKEEILRIEQLPQWLRPEMMHPLLDKARRNGIVKDNITDFAIMVLEYEYYTQNGVLRGTSDNSNSNTPGGDSNNNGNNNNAKTIMDLQGLYLRSDEKIMQPLLEAFNETALDRTIETWYPKCTRKEGMEPTLAQVNVLISDVLPKSGFIVSSKPEKVLGGYIIRGRLTTTSSSSSSSSATIDTTTTTTSPSTTSAIDNFITKLDTIMGPRAGQLSPSSSASSIADKMTVLYVDDFTVFTKEMINPDEIDFDSIPPILYVTGPDIVREPKPVQLSIVSAMGIATSWYLSLYPFLLNSEIAKHVDEQIAIADANMTPNLSFLTELSLPLFATFMGIQLIHELGHTIAAGANNIKISAPTFVPSIITGITSTVTTFKSTPKNRSAMFDVAVSGPLAGMIASLVAIVVGSQLTAGIMMGNDNLAVATYLPALPLEILRQSTLGGGIINAIIGNGILSVPVGALGTQAVAGMTVPLHPMAIAGFISLVVNALSMLPIGTTDGGRVGMCLFGRVGKIVVGQIFLIASLFIGLFGSDLFLFYFAFLIAFQTGNEIPTRNDIDDLDVPRVALAAGTFGLAVLALVPFQ